MGKRSTSPRPRTARGPDPFNQAARIWATGEAERRQQRAALEREVILVVGRHPVRGAEGHSPVQPVAPDPVLELHRRGQLGPVPGHFFSNIIGIYDEDSPPAPPLPRPPSPSLPSAHDRERTLEALTRRAEAARQAEKARETERRRLRVSPAQDAARAAQEQEHQRRQREVYEARRAAASTRRVEEVRVHPAPLPPARQVSRGGASPWEPTLPREVRGAHSVRGHLGRVEVERDVEAVVQSARRRREETSTLARERPPGSPELQEDVLRELNRKYDKSFREPWQMLAHLRRGADQLRASGGDPGRIQELASDHKRLHRALGEP